MVEIKPHLRPWKDLTKQEQLDLRLSYQDELDRQPKTCSMDEKTARFNAWLTEHGVSFCVTDLK